MRHFIQRVFERAVARRRDYRMFVAVPAQPAIADAAIRYFDHASPPPRDVLDWYDHHNGVTGRILMMARLKKQQASLLVLSDDPDPIAYGWLQLGPALRYEFGWLTEPWLCLGPYWTDEQQRGKGAYGRLLTHSLHIYRERFPQHTAYIWAQADNAASIRGIEKAGFTPFGTHRIATYGFGLVRRHRVISK
ncbi:MAG: GNAT family N-acetyltransferase [Phycisphaerae bacterium]